MAENLTRFVAHLVAQDRSPHTVTAYRRDVAALFNWLTAQIGDPVPPIQVTSFDVQRYRDHLVAAGRKPAGINRRLAALRAFFAWTSSMGQTGANPVTSVQTLKHIRLVPKTLSAQDVYRLQRTAAGQRQPAEARSSHPTTPTVAMAWRGEALLNLLLYTGLRVGEAVALRLDDVHIGKRSGKVIVRSGKGRRYREVPLNREARRALAGYLAVRPNNPDPIPFWSRRLSIFRLSLLTTLTMVRLC